MFDYWPFGAYNASNSSVIFPLLSMVLFAVLLLSAVGTYFFQPRANRPEGMLGFFRAIFARGLSSPRLGLVLVGVITILVLNVNLFFIYKAAVTPLAYPEFSSQVQSYCAPKSGPFSIWDFMWGPGKSLSDVVSEGFSYALHNCTDCYAIVLDFPLDMVFIVVTLGWIGVKWKRGPATRAVIGLTLIIMFVACLVALFVYELLRQQTIFSVWEDMQSHSSVSDSEVIVRMLLSATGFFLGAPILSVFFVIVYRASEAQSKPGQLSRSSDEYIVSIIRHVFPGVVFMAAIQIVVKGSANMVFHLTYSSYAWPLGVADIILNCGAWFLFPLPFLALRNRTGLISSLILLKGTWRRRFPYLVVLIFITVAADLLTQGINVLFSYLNALQTPTPEECIRGIGGTNAFRLSASSLNIVIFLLTFVILTRAFQSGYLDVGETRPRPAPGSD